MCRLWTVLVTTFWWQPCWTELLSWTQPSCWLVSLLLPNILQQAKLSFNWCFIYSQYCWKSSESCSSLFLPAGNESCPQPQTSEHLAAIEIMKLKHILILQNKIDLVKESQAKEQYEQILAFVQGELAWAYTLKKYVYQGAPCKHTTTPLKKSLALEVCIALYIFVWLHHLNLCSWLHRTIVSHWENYKGFQPSFVFVTAKTVSAVLLYFGFYVLWGKKAVSKPSLCCKVQLVSK